MADPRSVLSYEGLSDPYITFDIDNVSITYDATVAGGSSVVGRAVTLSDAHQVSLAADAEPIKGKLIRVESDNRAVVQVRGFMTLPAGTGASLTLGKKIVGDLLVAAEGYIREVDTAVAAELGLARGEIIDPDVTTAVVVCL